MSKKKKSPKFAAKKALRGEITQQLTGALADFRELLGEKKFNARIRKATKLISSGLKAKKEVVTAAVDAKEKA